MLKFISIKNFAIMDKLEIEFGPGFNLITGETGSGKSILVDAVGLISGNRAQQEMVRQGSESAIVEGLFTPADNHSCWNILEQAGIDTSEGEIIIRREITREGNNRAFINSRLVPLSLVSSLGSALVDIHGQHAQQDLLSPAFHLGYLDRYAGLDQDLEEYSSLYNSLQQVSKKLANLEERERDRLQRLDLLKFQINEIEQMGLDPEIDGGLEEEKILLANAEVRRNNSSSAYALMYEDDTSVVPLLDQALKRIEELKQMDPSVDELYSRMANLKYQTEELSYSIRDYNEKIEVDSQRLEVIEDRLNEIDKLKRKYGDGLDEILEYHRRISGEVNEIEMSEERDQQLNQEKEKLLSQCLKKAGTISNLRKKASSRMTSGIEKELAELAMKNVRFALEFNGLSQPGPDGLDQVEFLISTNKGEEPRPLAKIASGGELSRIMLALRTVLKSGNVSKSLVFDEVDAGIGGKTASVLGEKLARLAENQQVFCVTHLPQVAAFGNRHYHVGKEVHKGRTRAEINLLDQSERIEELSRLMGGETVTDTTRKQAWEMLSSRGAGR